MNPVQFKEWTCTLDLTTYQNGQVALVLHDIEDGQRIAVATVCLPEHECGPWTTFIKDYAENDGVLLALYKAGALEEVVGPHKTGFTVAFEVKLNPEFFNTRQEKVA